MKTNEQIEAAKRRIVCLLAKQFANPMQAAVLEGMVVALCWVVDSPNGSTLQRLLDGELMCGEKPTGSE